MTEEISDKNGVVCLLLCLLLGGLGVHRFYVGKVGTGILTIITIGGFFGIWPFIDLIMIICGAFTDANGRKVKLSN
jgi:TM2 domain-containing membrane protein YozV